MKKIIFYSLGCRVASIKRYALADVAVGVTDSRFKVPYSRLENLGYFSTPVILADGILLHVIPAQPAATKLERFFAKAGRESSAFMYKKYLSFGSSGSHGDRRNEGK